MHAIMMTSRPSLLYWRPETITIMKSIQDWRNSGIPVCFTIDAGPNVHCLCPSTYEEQIRGMLEELPGVIYVIRSAPGGEAHLLPA